MSDMGHHTLVCASSIRPEGIRLLEEAGVALSWLREYAPEEEMVRAVRDVDAILARVATVSKAVLDAAPRLRIVSRHGVGVDSVDVAECTRRGIVVATSGDANSDAVSEHAFACLLAAARQLTVADATTKAGAWAKNRFVGVELTGKTLGLVGLGRIGSRMARHARGFDMQVIAYDPYVRTEAAAAQGVSLVNLETLLRRADFVSLHVPRTTETERLLGRTELAWMKPTAILVNTARGGLIDEEALYDALVGGRLGAAALDVFEEEPLRPSHPLTQLDNVICSPHVAGQSQEALIRMSVRAAENILRCYRGERPLDVANPDVPEGQGPG